MISYPSGISFFGSGSQEFYRSWGRLRGQKNVCPGKISVCGRRPGRFATVLASLASWRAPQLNCADTYSSSFALRDSDSRRSSQSASLPEAATARSCATSPRTVLSSGVLPPASASNAAHALPVVRPSSPTAAVSWSETSLRCRLEEPTAAIGSPVVGQYAEPQPDLIAPKPMPAEPFSPTLTLT